MICEHLPCARKQKNLRVVAWRNHSAYIPPTKNISTSDWSSCAPEGVMLLLVLLFWLFAAVAFCGCRFCCCCCSCLVLLSPLWWAPPRLQFISLKAESQNFTTMEILIDKQWIHNKNMYGCNWPKDPIILYIVVCNWITFHQSTSIPKAQKAIGNGFFASRRFSWFSNSGANKKTVGIFDTNSNGRNPEISQHIFATRHQAPREGRFGMGFMIGCRKHQTGYTYNINWQCICIRVADYIIYIDLERCRYTIFTFFETCTYFSASHMRL